MNISRRGLLSLLITPLIFTKIAFGLDNQDIEFREGDKSYSKLEIISRDDGSYTITRQSHLEAWFFGSHIVDEWSRSEVNSDFSIKSLKWGQDYKTTSFFSDKKSSRNLYREGSSETFNAEILDENGVIEDLRVLNIEDYFHALKKADEEPKYPILTNSENRPLLMDLTTLLLFLPEHLKKFPERKFICLCTDGKKIIEEQITPSSSSSDKNLFDIRGMEVDSGYVLKRSGGKYDVDSIGINNGEVVTFVKKHNNVEFLFRRV